MLGPHQHELDPLPPKNLQNHTYFISLLLSSARAHAYTVAKRLHAPIAVTSIGPAAVERKHKGTLLQRATSPRNKPQTSNIMRSARPIIRAPGIRGACACAATNWNADNARAGRTQMLKSITGQSSECDVVRPSPS